MKKRTKILFFTAIFIIIVVAVSFTVFSIRKWKRDKTVNIAFFGLPQDLCKALEDEFLEDSNLILRFDVLAADNLDLGTVTKKYDMFFAWNGEVVQNLSASAEKIPSKILENIPISLRKERSIPILLDHYELAIKKDLIEKTQLNPEESFQNFTDFLHESKKYVFSPFFTNGSDDKTLFALVGSLTEALGGVEAYENLINQMQTYDKLEDFIEIGLNENGLSLADILNMLKVWPKEEILHPQWCLANKRDLEIFAENEQIGSFFTSLGEHRKINYRTISKFTAIKMPVADSEIPHGIIAPSVACVLVSDNANARNFLKKLLSIDVQTRLSDKTMLAPVHYRAEAFDSLSDDVRFWAASCAGGVLPDLESAVFQRKNDKKGGIAQEIRAYLK